MTSPNNNKRINKMTTVVLNVYDLSHGSFLSILEVFSQACKGMARQLSPMIIGKQIDGIWHTGVLVFGREFYYGGGMILFLKLFIHAGN